MINKNDSIVYSFALEKQNYLARKASLTSKLDNIIISIIIVVNLLTIILASVALHLLIKEYKTNKASFSQSTFIASFFSFFFIIFSFVLGIFIKVYSHFNRSNEYEEAIQKIKLWIAQYDFNKDDFDSKDKDQIMLNKLEKLDNYLKTIKKNKIEITKIILNQAKEKK